MHIEAQAKAITLAQVTVMMKWQALQAALAITGVPQGVQQQLDQLGLAIDQVTQAIAGGQRHD